MEKKDRMRVFHWRGLGRAAFGAAVAALVACQGNLGGGSGLSIPQAPSYNQPAGPAGAAPQSRQRILEGAAPASLVKAGANAKRPAAMAPAPPASPAADPSAFASGSLVAQASAAPSAAASAPSSAGSASPSGKPTSAPSPGASGPGPKISTKTTIYPDDAPGAPTPIPTGEVQTFYKRIPLVRGYVQPSSDLSLYGLAAVRFTLPTSELTPKRGFTIALFENGKHHHDRLLGFDTDPALSNGVVASTLTDPVVLKKGVGYLLLIYGDDTGPTPAPVASGYPGPGNNPFPMPSCSPPCPPQQQPYNPYATPTPYNPNPYAPPTPFNPYAPTPYANPFGSPHP